MKKLWIYNSVIIISLSSFVSVQAAPIDSTFSTGDTLTAEKMTEIKDAVTDNDTRTTANEGSITTNAASIGTNTGNITSNTSGVSTNTGNITSNSNNISDNTDDIATNTSSITTNTSNINTFSTGISTNAGNITLNSSAISVNTGKINTNISNIGINTSNTVINEADILTNTTAISNLFGGDGSDADLTVSSFLNWDFTPPTGLFFDNVTIDAGQEIRVPAGTTIRCSGTFTNNGTITVLKGAEAEGAFSGLATTNGPSMGMTSVAHPGDTRGTATLGDSNNNHSTNPVSLGGGTPGKAIPQAIAISSFSSFRIGGGSGAGYDNQGNAGGGLLKVYCNGAIVNNGSINATGTNGTNQSIAGGGGGIVILASTTSVDNSTGTIDVSGGNGDDAGSFGGNGGGGGGGIIIMVSPTTPLLGTETVTAGTGGSNTTANAVTTGYRTAGAGGGGSGGNGGFGGSVGSTGTPLSAGNGVDGYVITLDKDPSLLIH